MPIYTYRCPNCEHTEERKVTFEDRDFQMCERLLSTFRGPGEITGWSPDEPRLQSYGRSCSTLLVRDGIELTARTPGLWTP